LKSILAAVKQSKVFIHSQFTNGIMKNHYKTVYALPLRPSRMADFHCSFQTDTECHERVQRAKERDKRKV
jgi:hypothetical protein